MAGRIRSVKPEILDFEPAALLSDLAWRLWFGSWLLADDHGNLRAGARYLAASILQDTGKTSAVEAALVELGRPGSGGKPPTLELYQVDGQPFAHIVGWEIPGHVAHQRIANPSGPRVPGPRSPGASPLVISGTYEPSLGNPPPSSADLVESSPRARALRSPIPISDPDHRSPITDHRPERSGSEGSTSSPSPASPGEGPPEEGAGEVDPGSKGKKAIDLPLAELSAGERAVYDAIVQDPSLLPITKNLARLARDLVGSCPAVDVPREVRSLGAWLRANPAKAKKNGNAFLVRNLSRKQEQGGSPGGGAAPPGPAAEELPRPRPRGAGPPPVPRAIARRAEELQQGGQLDIGAALAGAERALGGAPRKGSS